MDNAQYKRLSVTDDTGTQEVLRLWKNSTEELCWPQRHCEVVFYTTRNMSEFRLQAIENINTHKLLYSQQSHQVNQWKERKEKITEAY